MDVYGATFLTPAPRTVETVCCVEASDRSPAMIAVGLDGGCIQLYDATQHVLLFEIPGSADRSLRRCVSIGSRLFSSGTHGQITEWDVSTLKEVSSIDSGNGAIWDMKVIRGEDTRIAIATESGAVVVYKVLDYELEMIATLKSSKKGARVLSVAAESGYLFTGDCNGVISRWKQSGKTYHSDLSFSVDKKGDNDTLVWQLLGLGDGRLVSGDSLGCLSVWDAELGVRSQILREHQADILATCHGNGMLYTSGVDAKIAVFTTGKEVKSVDSFFMNTRDVYTLGLINESVLVSGGVDGQVVLFDTKQRNFQPIKLDRFQHTVSSTHDGSLHLVLTKTLNPKSESNNVKVCVLVPEPQVVAEISLPGGVHTAAISPFMADSGLVYHIFLSGESGSRVVSFDVTTGHIEKVATTRKSFSRAMFTDEGILYLVSNAGNSKSPLLKWKMDDEEADPMSVDCGLKGEIISSIELSIDQSNGQSSIVIGTTNGSIAVIDSSSSEVISATKIKSSKAPVVVATALKGSLLYVLTSGASNTHCITTGGNMIICLNTKDMSMRWRKNVHKATHSNIQGSFFGLAVHEDTLVVLGERCLFKATLDSSSAPKEWTLVDTVSASIGLCYGMWTKKSSSSSSSSAKEPMMKRSKRIAPKQEVVLFAVDPVALEKALPRPFQRKSFHK